MYDTFAKSVTEYGSEIWTLGREFQDIESVQLRFIKMLLGVKSSTTNVATYAETARYPMYINFQLKIVKFYIRLIQMCNDCIVKKVFLELLKLDHLGLTTCNWVSSVKQMFRKCKIDDLLVYNDIETCDRSVSIISAIKQRLHENFEIYCIHTIKHMPILRTYCKLKHVFEMEPYLTTITSYNIRSIFSKFRLSSHVLAIEKGRHNNVPAEDRICQVCNSGEVEDELHLFFQCSLYNNERSTFYKICNLDESKTCNDKYNYMYKLMSDEKYVLYVGLFLKKCFEKRSKEFTDS